MAPPWRNSTGFQKSVLKLELGGPVEERERRVQIGWRDKLANSLRFSTTLAKREECAKFGNAIQCNGKQVDDLQFHLGRNENEDEKENRKEDEDDD